MNFLERKATVAGPDFSRWLVPPAAIAVHMCIGEVYGFSVFNVPLTRLIGLTESIQGQDWSIPDVGWIYSLALFMLGLSGALSSSVVLFSSPHARAPTFSAIRLALHNVADTGGRVIAAPRGPTGATPRHWLVVWS